VFDRSHHDFGVGDIRAINSKQATVSIFRNSFSPGGTYQDVIGPNTANGATLMVEKRSRTWRAKGVRGEWFSDPAE